MFKKLRIQLTMFSLLVITILLLIIAFAMFIGSPMNQSDNVNQTMLQVALSGEFPEQRIDNYRNRQGSIARLQVNEDGRIVEFISKITLTHEEHQTLASHVVSLPDNGGHISMDSLGEYIYLKVILNSNEDIVIVLQEMISTYQSLLGFASRIGPLLLLGLVLIFFASLSITQRALIPIRKAWDRQMEFTADASHELRTPLSVIQINLEAATDNPAETIGDNERWFENIREETDRMTKLVNDLLTLSRGDSGQQVTSKAVFPLDVALNKTAESMHLYAEQNGIQLVSDIENGLTINGDKELLCRLAIILMDNAIKYTTSPGTVKLTAKSDGRYISIKVSDTGVGIGIEHINKIFDRFYRADKSRSSNMSGSGLGLALAKWIVTEHGGTISVSSEVGNGSEFSILIPI